MKLFGMKTDMKKNPAISEIYPDRIHGALAGFIREGDNEVKTATLDKTDHGLTNKGLEQTDILVWWGHKAHKEV